MKIEFERGYPYDNPFARGYEYRLRILRSPLYYYRSRTWCGPDHRRWRQFVGDYISWLRRY